MKRSFFAVLLIFYSLVLLAQEKGEVYVTCQFDKVPFKTFITELEQHQGITFYYKDKWVDSLIVTVKGDSLPLHKALDKAILFSRLSYVLVDSNTVYLLPDKNFVGELPNYLITKNISQVETSEDEQTFLAKERYMKGREPDMIATIVVGSKNKARPGKFAIVTAKLVDEESGEALIGATLFIRDLKKGTATDGDGILNLALLPGKYTAEFQCLGMAETKCLLDVQSDGYFMLTMKKKVTSLAEVTVNGEESRQRGSKVGLERISIKSVKELPTLMGEKDVIKISQMLPGVVSVSEGSSGVNVRGGNADQNLFYLNDIPVYNTSHLFGFFSAINSTIINNFSLYKGHVPAEFGGRLSSVFNVETRKGNKKKFFTQGGISPVSANVEVETPIIKDKCSFMFSGRSSYSDWILTRLHDAALRNSSVKFYDFASAVDYELNDKNRVSGFGYYSSDYFKYNALTEYDYANSGASLNVLHRFGPGLKGSITAIGAAYQFMTIDNSASTEAYKHEYRLNHNELKGNLEWVLNEKHSLSAGFDITNYQLNRGIVKPYGSESIRKAVDLGNEQGIESALFIDDKYQVTSWFNLYGGFRFSNFTSLGPHDVYLYANNAPRETSNIIDTLSFNSGKKIVNYNGPEVRLASDIKIGSLNSIKFSFTQMRQYLFMLSNTISIAPSDQWKLVDYNIVPPTSNQLSAGYYRILPSMGLTVSTEVYLKQAKNIVEYKDGVDFLAASNVETTLLQGKQKAYGFEFMLSKEDGKLNGWVTYAYARSLITVDGPNSWDDINGGKTYPSNYDKPHVCNLILNYKFNRRFSLSSNMVYSTGRPITLPQGAYYIEGKPYVDYSSRNEFRIPDYFRIDASLTVEGNLKARKPFHSYWMFSVYNLTGRNNANSVYFRSEDGYLHGYKYSVIGSPIFTISWNLKLGNYGND